MDILAHIGGLMMWVPMCLIYVTAILAQLVRWQSQSAPHPEKSHSCNTSFVAAEQAGRVPLIGDWLARFIHKGERAASRRPWAIAVVCLSVIMIGSLWIEGQQSPWSPNFQALPLSEKVVGATSGPVFQGAQLFHDKACLNCHLIQGHGGRRGPDLTHIADKLTHDNMVIRIVNGGNNMPAFGSSLKPQELDALVAFLESRKRPLRPQDQSSTARN